jgi:hypothetical protein
MNWIVVLAIDLLLCCNWENKLRTECKSETTYFVSSLCLQGNVGSSYNPSMSVSTNEQTDGTFVKLRTISWQSGHPIFVFSTAIGTVRPIRVPAQSKAWTVVARSNAGIVGSNLTQGMNVCVPLFCVCAVMCVGSGPATGWSPVQEVLETVYRIKKLKKRPRPNKGL